MRIVKFAFAGVVNTIFSYILFAAFVYVGIDYPIAVLLCYLIGLIFNYQTIKRIAFADSDKGLFINFCIITISSYFLNVLGLKALLSIGINEYFGAWIVLLPIAIFNYTLTKKFVFKKS